MSRKCASTCSGHSTGFLGGFGQGSNCICNFPTLIILILIVLQFSKRDKDHGRHEDKLVDNGILFIIALFYLSCAGCGKGSSVY